MNLHNALFFRLAKSQAKVCLFVFVLCGVFSAATSACNIPVFRYALERWSPDPIEIVVFADAGKIASTKSDQDFVDQLEKTSLKNDAQFNTKIVVADPAKSTHKKLWKELSQGDESPDLPHLVARTEIKGKQVNNWSSHLKAAQAGLLRSPARNELRTRLLGGDSIVWLLVKSKDKAKSDSAKSLLDAECKKLGKSMELPEGIGLPGSELFADVPLLLRFSVLEIDASDPKEAYLVKLLSGFHPDALEKGEPLAAPVFGRGRALEVVPGNEMNSQLISELTQFLCGACSCKVKGLNPGFDLLIEAGWDDALFGPDGERPADTSEDKTPLPTLITIPPGRK